MEDVATEEMNAILGNKKIDDELRRFSRADQSRHLGDDIDTEVVDILLQTVSARYDIAHRLFKAVRLVNTPESDIPFMIF